MDQKAEVKSKLLDNKDKHLCLSIFGKALAKRDAGPSTGSALAVLLVLYIVAARDDP